MRKPVLKKPKVVHLEFADRPICKARGHSLQLSNLEENVTCKRCKAVFGMQQAA